LCCDVSMLADHLVSPSFVQRAQTIHRSALSGFVLFLARRSDIAADFLQISEMKVIPITNRKRSANQPAQKDRAVAPVRFTSICRDQGKISMGRNRESTYFAVADLSLGSRVHRSAYGSI
jgi:hypothetical protein